MPNAVAAAEQARFARDLTALTGEPKPRLLLAVSGGPDSLALMLLAHAAGCDARVATVDHGLRPESAGETALVAGHAAALGMAHRTLPVTLPPGNIMDAARRARYAVLETAADGAWVVTAHHADDQLETLLMRLSRGSGLAGLAGVRARQGRVVRPLLHWRRDDLAAIVARAGWQGVDDPANRDVRRDRARLRAALPTGVFDAERWSVSAAALAEAEEAIAWATEREGHRLTRDPVTLDLTDPPPAEIERRLWLAALAAAGEQAPRGPSLQRARGALTVDGARTSLGGLVITRTGNRLRFVKAPPRNIVR